MLTSVVAHRGQQQIYEASASQLSCSMYSIAGMKTAHQAVAISLAGVHVHVELAQALAQAPLLAEQIRRSHLMILGLLLVDGKLQLLPVVRPDLVQALGCACAMTVHVSFCKAILSQPHFSGHRNDRLRMGHMSRPRAAGSRFKVQSSSWLRLRHAVALSALVSTV